MIEQESFNPCQKIKCSNCLQIIQKILVYRCCIMITCQRCFDKSHYLTCANAVCSNTQVLNYQYPNQFFKVTQKPNCQSCDNNQVQQYCKNCHKNFCQQCSKKIHSKGKFIMHIKQALEKMTLCSDQIKNKYIKGTTQNKQNQRYNCEQLTSKFKNKIKEELALRRDGQKAQDIQGRYPSFVQIDVDFQITLYKIKDFLAKFREIQTSQLLQINTIQNKLQLQYQTICECIAQKFQANKRLLEKSKHQIQKQISQIISQMSKIQVQMSSLNYILTEKIFSEHQTNILKTRAYYINQISIKLEKKIKDYSFNHLQIKKDQIQSSLEQLMKHFVIIKSKNVCDDILLSQKSLHASNAKASRASSRLSSNRLNSASGKSVQKYKKIEQKQTTRKKSVTSCNYNQKKQMSQSYKVNFNKQRKQKDDKKQDRQNKHINLSQSFGNQIYQIQKAQHQQLNMNLNRLNKNSSFKFSQQMKLQFQTNVFKNIKQNEDSSQKKNQSRSNKFIQNSHEKQNKIKSISMNKNDQIIVKGLITPNITKLSIKKQLFQDKSNKNQIKTNSSRGINSKQGRQSSNSNKQQKQQKIVQKNISDFQQMSKQIDRKIKDKPISSHQGSKDNCSKKYNEINAQMTKSVYINHDEKQNIAQSQLQSQKESKINKQPDSSKQNCNSLKDNKNSSFATKLRKKSDILDLRDMMRKPNIATRVNIAERINKNK